MKKLLFSFVMMLALVIVAGTTMAQTKLTPYQGGKYTYNVPIGITTVGVASVTFSNTGMTISNPSVDLAAIPAATTSITFDVNYGLNVPVGTQTIYLTLTAGGCSNNIHLDVTVSAKPTLVLAINSISTSICQKINSSPSNNIAASDNQTTTFDLTVTPTIVASGTTTYDFLIDLTPNYDLFGTTVTIQRTAGDGTPSPVPAGSAQIAIIGATNAQTFTVSFSTTTGKDAKTFTGSLSNAKLKVTDAGGNTYDGTYSPQTFAVEVKAMPAIGAFN